MPTDRSNHNGRPPITPRLAPSVASAKTSSITPRLAASGAPANSSHSSRTVRSNASATPKASTNSHEDLSTPVKSFLSSNITPRSSSRKSRVGVSSSSSTPNATPSATPVGTRPASTVDFPSKEQGHGYSGLGTNGLNSAQGAGRPRSVVGGNSNYNATPTPRPPIANVHGGTSEVGGARAASPMFFHASEARPHEQAPAPAPKKAPVFFYANGRQDDSVRAAEVPSPPLSSVGRAQPESKFFHADSLSEARGASPILAPPPLNTSPEPWSNVNPTQRPPALRPPSPSKENIHLSYRKGASQVIRPNLHSRPSALSIISGHVQTPAEGHHDRTRRRSSAASSVVRLGHAKSTSLSSIDSLTSLRKAASTDLPTVASSPLQNGKRVISNSSIPESVQSEPTPPKEVLSGLPSPQLQSPTKTNGDQTVLERMNELAANARRERKVLDLEISNSSLLAINRQLEKEVRKQKTELRRFRRMSRAGRFSTDTIISNIPEYSVDGLGDLSDMDGEVDSFDEDHVSSSESSIDEGTLSPTALAERDEAHRLRDEKRLQLDLSKHRELLIDSQKMNQSLKRCLNWTEELIKDANKALAYNVRPSDVKLGGRVLTSEEHPEPEATEESRALLSPWTPTHTTLDPLDSLSFPGSERTDRDSGVDLDGQKPAILQQIEDLLAETPSRPPRSAGSIGDTY
ncbi:hypothetical protein BDV96DRAFT_584155 [Lophiotrema nucula]|uniref:Uncharacterized protein n=1 Tax=Lophiotrema nucula TaxID=690887 RepID=A0A6A5YSB6_9PLEO|nr:hypothetical protein BDV96DRAFT_584155 [Lophiotrema nucula]